jgi:N-glycosylase/DNA lyase
MCSGNNSLHRIIPMARSLGERGRRLENGAFMFPSLEELSRLTEAELRSAGFGYRARFIVQAIEKMQSLGGSAWVDSLRSLPYEEAWPRLAELPGIGRKISDCICLFGLDMGESVPVDTHIWQQLTRLYHPELASESLTARRYETVASAFRMRMGSMAGWAHQFLFEDNVQHGRSRRVKNPG